MRSFDLIIGGTTVKQSPKTEIKSPYDGRVGGVIHNDTSMYRTDAMPYDGTKDSGLGREGLRYAIEEMTEPRLLVIRA